MNLLADFVHWGGQQFGTIGTSKGHGASNTGYLNTCMYHLYSGQSVVMEI